MSDAGRRGQRRAPRNDEEGEGCTDLIGLTANPGVVNVQVAVIGHAGVRQPAGRERGAVIEDALPERNGQWHLSTSESHDRRERRRGRPTYGRFPLRPFTVGRPRIIARPGRLHGRRANTKKLGQTRPAGQRVRLAQVAGQTIRNLATVAERERGRIVAKDRRQRRRDPRWPVVAQRRARHDQCRTAPGVVQVPMHTAEVDQQLTSVSAVGRAEGAPRGPNEFAASCRPKQVHDRRLRVRHRRVLRPWPRAVPGRRRLVRVPPGELDVHAPDTFLKSDIRDGVAERKRPGAIPWTTSTMAGRWLTAAGIS